MGLWDHLMAISTVASTRTGLWAVAVMSMVELFLIRVSSPNITQLADHLHSQGQKLGIHVVPGGFQADVNKTILGTGRIVAR